MAHPSGSREGGKAVCGVTKMDTTSQHNGNQQGPRAVVSCMLAETVPWGAATSAVHRTGGGQAQVHGHPTAQSLTCLGNHFTVDVSSGFGLGGCLSPCRLGDLLVADKYQLPYQIGPHCDLSERAFLLLSRSVG